MILAWNGTRLYMINEPHNDQTRGNEPVRLYVHATPQASGWVIYDDGMQGPAISSRERMYQLQVLYWESNDVGAQISMPRV